MNSLAALNILTNDAVLNDNGVPLLFYWDGMSDIHETILSDTEFIGWLRDHKVLTTARLYENTKICYFYFNIDDSGRETYDDKTITIQEAYPLAGAGDELIYDIIYQGVNHLYNACFKENYGKAPSETKDDLVSAVYTLIKNKYGDKINEEIFINGIRSYYQTELKLDKDNIDTIISAIKNIFKSQHDSTVV